jgi:hypothetical protein
VSVFGDTRKEEEMRKGALIVQYTNLLHRWRDPNAKSVREFLQKHRNDAVFQRRAKVLNRLFLLKQSLVTH